MNIGASSFPRVVERVCSVKRLLAENPVNVSHTAGDLNLSVQSVAAPEHATAGSLVFSQVKAGMQKIGVILVTTEILDIAGGCCIVTADPRRWFVAALESLFPRATPVISQHAVIAASARISKGVGIGPFSVVKDDAVIGEGTQIGSHVTVHARSRIGRGCVIQDHSTIGSSGVAYYQDGEGGWYGLQHLGIVDIGDGVEVGSDCVVVRGILYDTVIETGTKIGNFVNIGHNAQIGENCWITSGALICGRVVMGKGVKVAAGACIRDKISVGNFAQIGLGAVVTKDVTGGAKLFGNPARPLRTMGSF